MALKGKGQAKAPNVDDNPQLGLESEIPVAPRSKRQTRQAEEVQAKDSTLKVKDKLVFNKDGALEKVTGAPPNKATINAIALSDAKQISNDVYLIKVAVFGNKAVSKN
ncbi:conserved hypothetical protein (plasmid) [Borreliella finlandensis]|uniref:Uncharacterized protein n=1 Tax=Borreliella finlandensis TaxID=498741 RepID=A0A806CN73_9SPIR|nr:conserved hypothetical protein [Borreliella finlandensis]